MKIEPVVKIASPSSRLEIYPDGLESAACFCGDRQILSIRRIKTGNFDEASGLVEKLRRHLANDSLSAEVDSENVIPFGCEYRVRRHWNFAGDIVEFTDDISADNGGRITDLFLEEIVFCGQADKVEYLLDGGEFRSVPAVGTVCETGKLPLLVRVIYADGSAAEFYSGDDFFRHNGAAAIAGASAEHRIYVDGEGVHWVRHVLITGEDTVVEKRPWRFKSLFAVLPPPVAGNCGENGGNIALAGCFAAPALHREFRNFVRKSTAKDLHLQLDGKFCCTDGSHISRPGRAVAHGMLGEVFDDYIWASGIAAKRGGSFTAQVSAPELVNSVICANLARPAGILEFIEPEEF